MSSWGSFGSYIVLASSAATALDVALSQSPSFSPLKVNALTRACQEVGRLVTLTKAILGICVLSSFLWSKERRPLSGKRGVTTPTVFSSPFFLSSLFCPEDGSCCCLEGRRGSSWGMLISRLSGFQSSGIAGSILQGLPAGSRDPSVSPARNTVSGKWQQLWAGFLISHFVPLPLDCLLLNSYNDYLPSGACLKY